MVLICSIATLMPDDIMDWLNCPSQE